MIISRSPFRLSLGGGGTDLPSYYTKHGGFFVSGAVNKYVHIAVNRRFEEGSVRVSYSTTEIVHNVDELKHPLVREGLNLVGIKNGIEIVSMADAPAQTGLGSSGSFCVGLLRALHRHLREERTNMEVAEEACDIAMNKLKEPSGKQDEYVASYGGINSYEISTDGRVKVEPLHLSTHTLAELEANLLMFYTGIQRSSTGVLSKQQMAIKEQDGVAKMHKIKQIGYDIRDSLAASDLTRFGELLNEHWEVKRGVTDGMSSDAIDHWYKVARDNGALGGKIIGAGGGGFLMIYCDNGRKNLRNSIEKEGLTEHRFRFDFEGSKIVYNV